MAGDTQVLREYLLSLGFRVNSGEAKKFDSVLVGITKQTTAAGAAVGTLAGLVVDMAKQYATSMEKLYYSSQRSGSTVKQIQALEYAGEQVGISSQAMRSGIEGMAKALRGNPGLTGLLKQLGVKTEGRTSAQEMIDLVDQLRKMPFFQAKQFASMFGLDEDTFQMLAQNLDKVKELAAERSKMDEKAGVDADENAKSIHDLINMWRELQGEANSFQGVIAKVLLNPLRETKGVLHEVLMDWQRIVSGKDGDKRSLGQRIDQDLPVAMGMNYRDKVEGHGASGLGATFDAFKRKLIDKVYGPGAADKRLGRSEYAVNDYSAEELRGLDADFKPRAGGSPAPAAPADRAAFLNSLERQYGLPDGTLDAIWAQESKRGTDPRAFNGKGAGASIGDFQITRKTGDAYGGWKADFEGQARIAAQIMADNISRHHDLGKALTAFNAGDQVASNPALGTDSQRAYAGSVLRRIEQVNNITIQSNDPRAVGSAVKEAMTESNGNLVREMRSVTQ